MRMCFVGVVLLGAVGLLTGCGLIHGDRLPSPTPAPLPMLTFDASGTNTASRMPVPLGRSPSSQVAITYLGTGGHLIERGGDAILLAPYFTHPPAAKAAIWPIPSNETLVRARLEQAGVINAVPQPSIGAVLVGHGHFDHAMDIPATVRSIQATGVAPPGVFGSEVVRQMLEEPLDQVTTVTALPAIRTPPPAAPPPVPVIPWTPVNGGTIRFIPLLSSHPSNIEIAGVGFTVSQTNPMFDRRTIPKRARDWAQGDVYAWIIDFMVGGAVDFRIYYQDAAHAPEIWHDPMTLSAYGLPANSDAAVDVAIVCVAGSNYVDGYIQAVQDVISPTQYLLGHWEDFLSPHTDDPTKLRAIVVTDPLEFIADLRMLVPTVNWVLPAPMTELTYP